MSGQAVAASWARPTRKILGPEDLQMWIKSQAYEDYMGFVLALNEKVKRKSLTEPCEESQAIEACLAMLQTLSTYVDETPPLDEPQRFGNKAYRTWHQKLSQDAETLLAPLLLGTSKKAAVVELVPYLLDSFGNATRIDYGTGHEVSFVMLLCCLFKLEVLHEQDSVAVVNRVFESYLALCRKLQLTYRMEPAGSQGVWNLDDFQFLPFLWGSAQLIDHPQLEPSSFVQAQTVEKYAGEYTWMRCINFIGQVKTGPFAEHSNQLWNISSVPAWSKVNAGLIKMYKAEVLAKFPIVQHFVFGTLLSIQPAKHSSSACSATGR